MSSTSFYFIGALNAGNLPGSITKLCRYAGCNSVIDIELVVREAVPLMQALLRDRARFSANEFYLFSSSVLKTALLDCVCFSLLFFIGLDVAQLYLDA